jgi:hypothetical protein
MAIEWERTCSAYVDLGVRGVSLEVTGNSPYWYWEAGDSDGVSLAFSDGWRTQDEAMKDAERWLKDYVKAEEQERNDA